MKEINKFFYKILFFILLTFSVSAENKILNIGDSDAKITIKVFSSLTCPHCASFHKNIFEDLKKEYMDKGIVKFEHHGFPLDLAALNAEIIVRCHLDNKKSSTWAYILYNQALLNEGSKIKDPMHFTKQISELMLSA